ncbi:MAG: ABC transporter permease [Actinomycetota bacterium]|nr:ABC transporter permease [Actinomycetota bacterium]
MTDIDVVTDEHAPEVPVLADAPVKKVKVKRRGRITKWLAIGWLAFITISAIGANSLPYIPHSCEPGDSMCSTAVKGSLLLGQLPPKWAFFSEAPKPVNGAPERMGLMGTDKNGFDIFSRSMLGARNSLIIAGLAITFGLAIGTFLGMIAGYFRGKVDTVIENISNVMLAFPALLLAIFLVTFFNDPNTTGAANSRPLWPIILALVVLSIPPLTRLVRANTIAYAQRDFVVAARSLGAKGSRILFREILPNIVPTLLSFALTGLAILIVAEGGLAFLGLSVEAPVPTWGAMIAAGSEPLRNGAWWISLMPAFVMFLTVLSINLLGDVLAQRFNSREAIG